MGHEQKSNVEELKRYLYFCINNAKISVEDKEMLKQLAQDFIGMYKEAIYEQLGFVYL